MMDGGVSRMIDASLVLATEGRIRFMRLRRTTAMGS
jgi:hypothetical protein